MVLGAAARSPDAVRLHLQAFWVLLSLFLQLMVTSKSIITYSCEMRFAQSLLLTIDDDRLSLTSMSNENSRKPVDSVEAFWLTEAR